MIRTLLATTGLALVLAAAPGATVFAQDSVAPEAAGVASESATGPTMPGQLLASSLLGKTVYTGVDEEGEAIGDVNDVVINANGGTEALVIGVGGFLGIGNVVELCVDVYVVVAGSLHLGEMNCSSHIALLFAFLFYFLLLFDFLLCYPPFQ